MGRMTVAVPSRPRDHRPSPLWYICRPLLKHSANDPTTLLVQAQPLSLLSYAVARSAIRRTIYLEWALIRSLRH